MDPQAFDRLARSFGQSASRRRVLGGLLGGALAAVAGPGVAKPRHRHKGGRCKSPQTRCGKGKHPVCVNLQTDPDNCGQCGATCRFPNAKATCANSACTMGACDQGFADCDHDPSTGCEVNTQTDHDNCGACGLVCGGTKVCCGGACTHTDMDAANCGGCGRVCPAGLACPGSECVCADSRLVLCGAVCVGIRTDRNNCGACGNVCPAGQICCGAVCVDPLTDPNNCGTCGAACGAGCVAGVCST